MPPSLMTLALTTFGASRTDAAAPTDAQSGAEIYRVGTAAGVPAYLKLTSADGGTDARAAAERELRFYRQLASVVPVRTPPLLGELQTDHGVALLLGDAGTQRDAGAWTDQHWRTLGRELALLHAMPLPGDDWSRSDGLLAAIDEPDLYLVRSFWLKPLPQLGQLLAARNAWHDRLRSLPPAFAHGDCHTGNIVHDDEKLVFCDWQSTGLGRATSDLAFLSVRATPSGTHIPAVVVEEYLRQCARVGAELDPAGFEQAVLLEELALLVFQWPQFAAYNNAASIGRVHRRARRLADRLTRWQ